MRVLKFLSILLLSASSLAATVKVKSSNVTFTATGNPGFLTIEGHGAKISGLEISRKDGAIMGEAYCDLRVFTTDMDLRDDHMHKKYLESKRFPRAKLEFTGINGHFVGELTLKGVTKKVAGNYTLKGNSLQSSFKVNLKDFPIGVPSWLGVTVAEIVEVKVKAKL
jgi:polyisoprenoid-binding protein YceI